VKGKLAYMSPQQVCGEALDRRADIYAAGVVLWEVLTGERLFSGDNDGAIVMAVRAGPQRAPREVQPSVPEPIDRECMRALSIDPEARHPTALAFAEALEAAAAEANVPLATPRALAAYVKALGAHKSIAVPPAPDPPKQSASGSDAARAATPVASIEQDERPPSASARETLPEPSQPSVPAADGSQVSSVVSPIEAPRPAKTRTRMLAGLAALGAVGALGLLGVARWTGAKQDVTATAATPGPAPTAPPTTSATSPPVVTPAPSAAPPPTAFASAPPPSTAPKGPAKPRAPHTDDWRPKGL
jgi:serine/threonine-protein kinase